MENRIPELEKSDLYLLFAKEKTCALYLHTPLCGTCKVGEQMLQVVYAMHPTLPLYKADLNFLPELAQEWQIMSVPCLAILKKGKLERKVYAMRSVVDLLMELQPLLQTK